MSATARPARPLAPAPIAAGSKETVAQVCICEPADPDRSTTPSTIRRAASGACGLILESTSRRRRRPVSGRVSTVTDAPHTPTSSDSEAIHRPNLATSWSTASLSIRCSPVGAMAMTTVRCPSPWCTTAKGRR